MHERKLTFVTYLSPSLPLELFALITRAVGERLGIATSLVSEPRTSGPVPGAPDPFSSGEADVGFMCSPPYLWLREATVPAVELLPVGMVPLDPRCAGRPVYFSDVITRLGHRATTFGALAGGTWAFNDPCSLSGSLSLLVRLSPSPRVDAFFGSVIHSGSHLSSIEMVLEGSADAAAIDSNVLAVYGRRNPSAREGLRVLESWGPNPIQPVVVRSELSAELKGAIAEAILDLGTSSGPRAILEAYGFREFVPIAADFYDREAALLGRYREMVGLLPRAMTAQC